MTRFHWLGCTGWRWGYQPSTAARPAYVFCTECGVPLPAEHLPAEPLEEAS